MTDQHNPHIAGFAGDVAARTPSLDLLAAEGAHFTAAYCQSPLCVPSRMSMLTGRYALGCEAFSNSSVIPSGMTTLPGVLSAAGYRTAAIGKMHFRGQEQMHGFDDRPFGDLVDGHLPAHQPDPPDTADGRWNGHAAGRFPFAGPTSIPTGLSIEPLVTLETLEWIREQRDARPDQPWFAMASYPRPHFPLTAPARYVRGYESRDVVLPPAPADFPDDLHPHDRFIVDDFRLTAFSEDERRTGLIGYYAALEFADAWIGELLAGLRNDDALDETYVIYTSDHGDMAGEHGLWWKRTYYDASARVPLIVRGPGVAAGARHDWPVELVDLFPTICDWAGASIPPGLDGETLRLIIDGTGGRAKVTARSELLGGNPHVRFRMARDRRWKYVDFPDARPRLFDLVHDPDELHDLAHDPPADAPVADLRAALVAFGEWPEIDARREAAEARTRTHRAERIGTVQYRLADGRLIDADAALYEGFVRTESGPN